MKVSILSKTNKARLQRHFVAGLLRSRNFWRYEKEYRVPDLIETRENWYLAYFSGDVRALQKIESSSFVYIENGIKVSNHNRYQNISALVSSNQWSLHGAVKSDTIEVHNVNEFETEVVGNGTIKTTCGKSIYSIFKERWKLSEGKWVVTQLELT